jgi:hypothetical protein
VDTDVETLPTNNGLVGTVLTAYNLHQNLQLRPDDLWITILAQFSAYVNGRAEELRDEIVSHEGQKHLRVVAPGNIYTADFGSMTQQFLDKIAENIKDGSLREWFLPGFTTTTETDKVAASAMAMCSFQEYFTYEFSLICGIPQVTLLGSVDDWLLLRSKVDRLAEFDGQDKILSGQWLPLLQDILDNFVESAQNGSENNLNFWDNIVSDTIIGCAPDFISGWISTFTMFGENGEVIADMSGTSSWPMVNINPPEINPNVASCPATVDDNGHLYNATLFVGQMAYELVPDTAAAENPPAAVAVSDSAAPMRILKPRNDWALVIEEGFVELPPKNPDSADPPDATVVGPFEYECPVVESYVPWQFNRTNADQTNNDTIFDGNNKTAIPSTMGTSSSDDDGDVQPVAWIAPVAVAAFILGIGLFYFSSRRSSATAPHKEVGAPIKPADE